MRRCGNNSGKPTAAQSEWIAEYTRQTEEVVAKLDALKKRLAPSLGMEF